MIDIKIFEPNGESEIAQCLELAKVLRPHLGDMTAFLAQMARQAQQGYALLAASHHASVVGLAGYRFQENLMYGRFLYVDDLVTAPSVRSHGIGRQLLNVLETKARRSECKMFVLDTGVRNVRAQEFYRRQGMEAVGLHFTRSIN